MPVIPLSSPGIINSSCCAASFSLLAILLAIKLFNAGIFVSCSPILTKTLLPLAVTPTVGVVSSFCLLIMRLYVAPAAPVIALCPPIALNVDINTLCDSMLVANSFIWSTSLTISNTLGKTSSAVIP